MKKFLLIGGLMTLYVSSIGQLKLTENFTGMTNGGLVGQNSWVTNGSGTDVQVTSLANNTGALTYPGYTSGQTYIDVDRYSSGGSGLDPHKLFISTVSTSANTTFFISFVVRVPSATTVATTGSAEYSVTLRNSANSNYLSRFFIGKDGSNNIEFGISCGQGAGNAVWTNGNYAVNTTYLIVIRYDIETGSNNDDMWLWVNPSSFPSEPSTGSANASQANAGGNEANYGTNVDALMLHQRNSSNSPYAFLDAFKIAIGTGQASTAANASASWTNLSPQGAPLPVKFGNINAFEKQMGIQLNWIVYSEESMNKYQIERSSDGQSFISVGEVASRNSPAETSYGFFDASPSAGLNFYRLRSIDLDGKFAYSAIVKVNLNKGVKDISLYPNPVTGGFISFQGADLAKGNYTVRVYNSAGLQVMSQNFTHTGGAINQTLKLPAGINSGMYSLQLVNDDVKVMSKTFMIQ